MSRSYKKYPMCKQGKSNKIGKRCANNKVRMYLKSGKEITSGKLYKRIFESWEICDYHFSTSWKEWKRRWGNNKFEWYKIYKMK